MDYQKKYELWLNNVKDVAYQKELLEMSEEQKKKVFFKDIEFGTAGMRGIVGLGSNCMNIYTVGRVTEAICVYMKNNKKSSIAVSYDTRKMSDEFAKLVSCICASHGIKVYLSKDMMPTPFLSYMVRYYKTDMGVMITASHNPKDYNGYKVYDCNGSQLLEKPAREIMKIAGKVDQFTINQMNYKLALKSKLIVLTDSKIKADYFKEVQKRSINRIENLKVVYTALNGTGIQTLPELIHQQGAKVILNKTQCKPDENFTTCPYPNPEKIEVYNSSIEIAKKHAADVIVASDPDADRIGIMALHNGDYVYLTGNQMGALLADYLLSNRSVSGGFLVRSVVSTSLVDKIAKKYGAKVGVVLTGFKYIGDFIKNLEDSGEVHSFVLGFEESHGYLVGDYVRDKDATLASMLMLEIASQLKKQNKTLVDKLNEIYAEFGYFDHKTLVYKFEGSEGNEKMQKIMKMLTEKHPVKFGVLNVIKVRDYSKGVGKLPKASMVEFELERGARIIIRPSGTEPVIKVYITLSETKQKNEVQLKKLQIALEKMFK